MNSTPEMQTILNQIADHQRTHECQPDMCLMQIHLRKRLKALGYTFTLPEIMEGEIL